MLREALWTLRQRRYARLTALMVVIAGICILAGTWQIQRFEQSVHDNDALKRNAHAAAAELSPAVVPLVGDGPAPGRDAIRYRTVTTTGTYLGGHQEFVRGVSQGGVEGYLVLEPFRTTSGVLLVVRGFVASGASGDPKPVSAPPSGLVRIRGRLQTASSKDDRLTQGEVRSVNPARQADRLGQPVYNAYVTLTAGQPGTSGVAVLPKPDLSNPAGGAYEAQHFAYIVQWYLFAVLALAAPFVMSRAETREAQRRFLGLEPGTRDFDRALAGPPMESPQLESGVGTAPAAVAVRPTGAVARAERPSPQRWQRGNRLADRYGRSFGVRAADLAPDGSAADGLATDDSALDGPATDGPATDGPATDDAARSPRAGSAIAAREPVLAPDHPSSAAVPYRSPDAYHGSYNDYLWELALADGDIPPSEDEPLGGPGGPGGPRGADAQPRTPLTVATVQPDGRAVITSHPADDPPATGPER